METRAWCCWHMTVHAQHGRCTWVLAGRIPWGQRQGLEVLPIDLEVHKHVQQRPLYGIICDQCSAWITLSSQICKRAVKDDPTAEMAERTHAHCFKKPAHVAHPLAHQDINRLRRHHRHVQLFHFTCIHTVPSALCNDPYGAALHA